MIFSAKEARGEVNKFIKPSSILEKDFSYIYKIIEIKSKEGIEQIIFPITSDGVLVVDELFSDKVYDKKELIRSLMENEYLVGETTDGFLQIQW